MTKPGSYQTDWCHIDQTENPAYYVEFIDRVRQPDDAPQQYQVVFSALDAQPGDHVLDVGCGTGGAMRALARQVEGIGRVVGIDNSTVMLDEAEKRAAGLDLPLAFRLGDGRRLPFADDSFDRCYSVGVFEIIEQPQTVLAEMVRVLRPGGRLVIGAGDTDASMIDATDVALTRKIIHYACDYEGNGLIGRRLPGYCHDLGLVDIEIAVRAAAITRYEMWAELWWRRWAAGAQAAGVITAVELTSWLEDLQARDRAGKFFASMAGVVTSANKP